MVDGASSLLSWAYGAFAVGFWQDRRQANMLDGGAHFYGVYETRDGKYVAIGAIEPQFYAELLRLADLESEDLPDQLDASKWPDMRERFAGLFKTKTRDQWCALMEGTDACFAPVLSLAEAADHPHMKSRQTFVEVDGVVQPGPAPRFARTKSQVQGPPSKPGTDTDAILAELGFGNDEIAELRSDGTVGGPS